MLDKCTDTGCQLRNACKRFTEPPEKNQTYFKASPRWRDECDFYFPNGTNLEEQRQELAEERKSFIQDVMN
jgi:hypothetical protein